MATQVDIEIFYKFHLDENQTDIKQKEKNDKKGAKEENEINQRYYLHLEFPVEKKQIDINEILKDGGYNENFLKSIDKFKYLLVTDIIQDEIEIIEKLKVLEQSENAIIDLDKEMEEKLKKSEEEKREDKIGHYILYLYIIIDRKKEEERIKNENDNERTKEKNDIKLQLSNIEQISNELRDIKKQIYNIELNSKADHHDVVKSIQKNININKEKYKDKLKNYELNKIEDDIIGRKMEIENCLNKIQNENKLCIFGPKGVGKKIFTKKVGSLLLEKKIFDKIYFLDINSIDNYNPEIKINLLIDGICESEPKNKILLIIYFNEEINEIFDLKQLLYKLQNEKNEKKISIIFTFSLNDSGLIETQKELSNHIELTNFTIEGKENEKNNLKNLFEFYFKKNNITDRKDLVQKVNEMFDNLTETPSQKEKEKKEDKNEIKVEKEEENNIKEEGKKQVKKIDIILLVMYVAFTKDGNSKIEKIFEQLILNDDMFTQKEIITKTIIESGFFDKDTIEKILLYLNKFISGIGKSFFKMILNDNNEEKINFIKTKLNGLIIIDNNKNEEIFRLDNSAKTLIEEQYKFDNEKIKKIKEIEKNIIKYYFSGFRNRLNKEYQENNIDINLKTFNACVQNNFWYNEEIKKEQEKLSNENITNYKFNSEIDSNNIYNIIKNIKADFYNDNEIQIYINDISISLPTLLCLTDNYYLVYLIIDSFENMYEKLIKEEEENKTKINEIILRLGIFKYEISHNPKFFEKSLKLANISDETIINLSKEAKFEYYLSKIFDCSIRKKSNIKELILECNNLLNEETVKEKIKIINTKRLNDIYKIEKNPRKIFYFLFDNPLDNELKTDLNNNFYLAQKLKTIIPSTFDIEFKSYEDKNKINKIDSENFKDFNEFFLKKNNLINISFLYISSKDLKEKFFKYCENEQQKGIINTKILILGYLGNDEDFEKEKEILVKKGIKNIIYISKNSKLNLDKDVSAYDKKSYYYYLEKYFIEFIHDFVSFITSKYDYCSIQKAFNKVKIDFISKFRRLIELNEPSKNDNSENQKKEESLTTEDFWKIINIESSIEDDNFEMEYNDDEEETLNKEQKVIKDIYDEYEHEYNKMKNIYYRKNPFSEESETKLKKIKYKNYMKLPGIGDLSAKNFLRFAEKGLYITNKGGINELKEAIIKNNIVNIYGNNNVFELGDELCKYFYMMGKFQNGIYIFSQRGFEEGMIYLNNIIRLKDNENKDNNNRTLILLKLLDLKDKESIIKKIKSLNEKNSAHFVVCSESKSESSEKVYYYEWKN